MKTYIILLRGINVSGKNRLKMEELKTMLKKHNLKNCQTYIQSGNIVLTTNLSKNELKHLIEKQLLNEFSIETEALIFNRQELLDIFNSPNYQKEETKQRYFTFLNTIPGKENLDQLTSITYPLDSFTNEKNVIYINCPGGYGKTKLNNNFFEKKLGIKATTRNYNTVKKLIDLSE